MSHVNPFLVTNVRVSLAAFDEPAVGSLLPRTPSAFAALDSAHRVEAGTWEVTVP